MRLSTLLFVTLIYAVQTKIHSPLHVDLDSKNARLLVEKAGSRTDGIIEDDFHAVKGETESIVKDGKSINTSSNYYGNTLKTNVLSMKSSKTNSSRNLKVKSPSNTKGNSSNNQKAHKKVKDTKNYYKKSPKKEEPIFNYHDLYKLTKNETKNKKTKTSSNNKKTKTKLNKQKSKTSYNNKKSKTNLNKKKTKMKIQPKRLKQKTRTTKLKKSKTKNKKTKTKLNKKKSKTSSNNKKSKTNLNKKKSKMKIQPKRLKQKTRTSKHLSVTEPNSNALLVKNPSIEKSQVVVPDTSFKPNPPVSVPSVFPSAFPSVSPSVSPTVSTRVSPDIETESPSEMPSETPTFDTQVPEDFTSNMGIIAPLGTPPEVVEQLIVNNYCPAVEQFLNDFANSLGVTMTLCTVDNVAATGNLRQRETLATSFDFTVILSGSADKCFGAKIFNTELAKQEIATNLSRLMGEGYSVSSFDTGINGEDDFNCEASLPPPSPVAYPTIAPATILPPTGTKSPTKAQAPSGTKSPTKAQAPTGTKSPTKAQAPSGTESPTKTDSPSKSQAPSGTESPTKTDSPSKS